MGTAFVTLDKVRVVRFLFTVESSVSEEHNLRDEAIFERTPAKSFISQLSTLHLLYGIYSYFVCNEFLMIMHGFSRPLYIYIYIYIYIYLINTHEWKTNKDVGHVFILQDRTHQPCFLSIFFVFLVEFLAIREAIKHSNPRFHRRTVTIFSDSQSVLQASSSLNPLEQSIQDLLIESPLLFRKCLSTSRVRIARIIHAGALASECTTLNISPISIPRSDYLCPIKKLVEFGLQSMTTFLD